MSTASFGAPTHGVWRLAKNASSITVPACPACTSTEAEPRFGIEGIEPILVVCSDCGLGRLHPLPDLDTVRSSYPDEYYGGGSEKFEATIEHLTRLVASWEARRLLRGLPHDGRALDFGCGRGTLLSALADHGLETHGVEISEVAAAGADPRAQIRIAWSLGDARYDDDYFDLVVLWHVLEHLSDPRETLLEARRILRPGGRLAVAIPNFSSLQARLGGPAWFHLDPPRHLFHFSQQALETLLRETGFEPGTTRHFSLRYNPFGWVQSFLNMSGLFARDALYLMLRRDHADARLDLSTSSRMVLRLAYYLGMPMALAFSLLATLARSGATIDVLATTPAQALASCRSSD